jgi:ABC-2 type transport system ATP-binding protein
VAGNQVTRARIDAVLAQVDLADRAGDAYQKYSLGMKQRLGIAAALLTEPELIILDEPTNGLDPAGIVDVRALIGRLARQGMTIILSSHQLYEVQQICSRVAILNLGTTVAQGQVAELLAAQSGIVVGFDQPEVAARAMAALQAAAAGEASWLRGVRWVAPELGAWVPPGGWLIAVDAPVERAAEVCALLARQGLYPAELRRREGSLEQYFLALTGGQNGNATSAVAPAAQPPTQGGAR